VRVRLEKSWQTFVRLGGGDYQCNPREEARFLRDADTETYDTGLLPDRTFADLDAHSVAWLRALVQPRTPSADPTLTHEAWLTRYGLLRDGKPTRAAILLCGDLPATIALNPSPRVDFASCTTDTASRCPRSDGMTAKSATAT
jgi:predicted HTH transcriptional regulator